MRLFVHGSPDKPPGENHTLFVASAAHVQGETPAEWWDVDRPSPVQKQIMVHFKHGRSEELPDALAKYLLHYKMAEKTPRPVPQGHW